MAYTQEQINAALVAELAARPNTPQADLSAYAKATYGLTDAQIANAYAALNNQTAVANNNTNNYSAGTVVNQDGSVQVGDKLYSKVEADIYNAYRNGNMAEVNRLLAANKLTGADIKSTFGLTDADIAWITNNAGGKFYSPTTIKTGITDPTKVITGTPPIQTATVGQFKELFPSFEESKRLAGQMVANRPTTQSIINMINSNAARPVTIGDKTYSAPESALYNAYRSGNMPEFNRLTQANQLKASDMQSKFGLSDADMAYIANNAGGTFYNPSATQQTVAPSLNNVLNMISK